MLNIYRSTMEHLTLWFAILRWDIFRIPKQQPRNAFEHLKPADILLYRGGMIPVNNEFKELFREAISEIGATLPPDVPKGYSILRFADTDEFHRLLDGAGLADIKVEDHKTNYLIPDIDTLWRGGLGSFAVTASAIAHQDAKTQAAIRAALERRAAVYMTPSGIKLPVAFKIGSGTKS